MFNDIMKITLFFVLVCSLLSCGGGSSVSSVSLEAEEAESTQLLPGGRITLVAQADDSNPSGDSVSWSFRENNSGAVLDVINNELDGNHQARAIYIAGNNPGIDVVQVSFKSGAKATVTITVGYDVNRIKLEQFGWTILGTVFNSMDLPVPGAQLDFFITAGTIFHTLDPIDQQSATTTVITNQNGITDPPVMFRLPDGVNTARVTASSGTVSATLDVVRTFATSSVQSYSKGLSTSQMTSSIYVEQEGNTIKAKLLDSSGSPVVGVLLKFTIKDGILDHEMIFTDDDGLAEQMFLLDKDVSQSEIIVEGGGMSATLVVK